MPSPVRYTAGLSTAAKGSTLQNLPMPDRTRVIEYFDDFLTDTTAAFTYTEIGGGGSVGVVADEPGGALILTSDALDNDACQIQLPVETFTLASGKKAWFKTRLKMSEATQSDVAFGLVVLDTTILGATGGDGATDGLFFWKDDASTSVSLSCQKNATTGQVNTAVGTMSTAYQVWGFEFDGARYVRAFLDDVHVATLDLTATLATYLPDTALTVSFAFLNGDANARTMTVDYAYAAIER